MGVSILANHKKCPSSCSELLAVTLRTLWNFPSGTQLSSTECKMWINHCLWKTQTLLLSGITGVKSQQSVLFLFLFSGGSNQVSQSSYQCENFFKCWIMSELLTWLNIPMLVWKNFNLKYLYLPSHHLLVMYTHH